MPRVPLRNACARPPEGEPGPSCLEEAMPALLCFASLDALTNRRLRMPLAGGRVESSCRGMSGMDAAKELGVPSTKNHGWPLYAGPRSGDGAREVRLRSGRTRMKGRAFFCLLFFARAKKSEAPCKAQPALRAEECATSSTNGRAARCVVAGTSERTAITRISPRKWFQRSKPSRPDSQRPHRAAEATGIQPMLQASGWTGAGRQRGFRAKKVAFV